jgi:hypothetical protein
MASVTQLLPLFGATIGIVGFLTEIFWLLVIGALLCGLNEFLNIASGVYKVPFVATTLVILCSFVVAPWYVGAMLGLCIGGAMDGLGEMYGRFSERRS